MTDAERPPKPQTPQSNIGRPLPKPVTTGQSPVGRPTPLSKPSPASPSSLIKPRPVQLSSPQTPSPSTSRPSPPEARRAPGQGRHQNEDRPEINELIRSQQVRLIASDGEQVGIVDTTEALRRAQEESLDLVVISAQNPPVAKIMNYGKYKFDKEKQDRENKKKSKAQGLIKELKFSPRIDSHDLEVKERKVWEWLEEGHKVRVVVQMRGREMQHPELARKLLEELLERALPYGKSDRQPAIKLEGKMFSLQLTPNK